MKFEFYTYRIQTKPLRQINSGKTYHTLLGAVKTILRKNAKFHCVGVKVTDWTK